MSFVIDRALRLTAKSDPCSPCLALLPANWRVRGGARTVGGEPGLSPFTIPNMGSLRLSVVLDTIPPNRVASLLAVVHHLDLRHFRPPSGGSVETVGFARRRSPPPDPLRAAPAPGPRQKSPPQRDPLLKASSPRPVPLIHHSADRLRADTRQLSHSMCA